MIIVNVRQTGAAAVTDQELQANAAGDWVVGDSSIQAFGDYLVAVIANRVVGAWTIDSHRRVDGKVRFDLSPAPDLAAELTNQPSPVAWKRGQANPIKLVHTKTLRPPEAEVVLTPQGNRRVQLEGWTLIVYSATAARVQPQDGSKKLVVEHAFPGPNGANVQVRLVEPDWSKAPEPA